MRFLVTAFIVFMLVGCSPKKDESRIYFVARAVPGANIFSTDLKQKLIRHTKNSGSRDRDMTIDSHGNLFFTSNRILAEDRAERAAIGKRGSRRQDLNVFYLPAGEVEETINGAAEVVAKTDMPESLAVMSANGKNFSFVRTLLPDNRENMNQAAVKKRAFDELYILQDLSAEPSKIYEADVIIKPSWSNDSSKLAFGAYDFENEKAKLLVYDVKSQKVEPILENPWGINQIDSPQWAPGDQVLSVIMHPIEKDKLRTLYKMNLSNKKLEKVSADLHSVQSWVSWGKDGKSLVYGAYIDAGDFSAMSHRPSEDMQAHIFHTNFKDAPKQLTQNGVYSAPVLSPNNKYIAYLSAEKFRSRKASLQVMTTRGEPVATLHDNVYRQTRLYWQ